MEKIKLVSWDVYGTLIATPDDETSDCGESRLKLRSNCLEVLTEIKNRKILQCTSSDGDLCNLKNNLREAGITWTHFFYDLYLMPGGFQKDYSFIRESQGLRPGEMLVVGNNYPIDLELAKTQGFQTVYVPEGNSDLRSVIQFLDNIQIEKGIY